MRGGFPRRFGKFKHTLDDKNVIIISNTPTGTVHDEPYWRYFYQHCRCTEIFIFFTFRSYGAQMAQLYNMQSVWRIWVALLPSSEHKTVAQEGGGISNSMSRRKVASSSLSRLCCTFLLFVHFAHTSFFDCCSILHIQSKRGAAKHQSMRLGKYRFNFTNTPQRKLWFSTP